MIKFGTGGWRAIIADEFTKENIRLVVAGLCKLMLLEGHAGKEICVGYDRRFLSKESAHWAAEVLAGYGFHVFVVARSSPTPLIMFTVKQMQTPYGLAVTASHNPKEYNGYKVYWADGAQLPPQHADAVAKKMGEIDIFDGIKRLPYEEAVKQGFVTIMGEETDEKFLAKAPEDVIQRERDNMAKAQKEIQQLESSLADLG